jgi:hypothetical protein
MYENNEIPKNKFEEPWHTEYLPDFPLKEGETYLVPLKLLSKERRFDGGRGTEFYTFGIDNWRKITFSDQSIPEIMKDEKVLVKQVVRQSTFC